MRLVLIKGRLETLDYFTDCIAQELRVQNIPYYVVDANDIEHSAGLSLHEFITAGDAIFFTFNNIGILLNEGEENFWEKYNIPIYSFIVDHPRNYGDILNRPPTNYSAICLDKNHVSFVKRFYPKVENVYFIPNGGMETANDLPYTERDIAVLYLGDCQEKVESVPVLGIFPDGGKEFYEQCVSQLLSANDLPTEEVIERTMNRFFSDATEDMLRELNEVAAGFIEAIVRRHFKQRMIRALDAEGVEVEIYGGHWEDEEYIFGENIHIHPRISSAECNRIIGRACITLNFLPWYKNGSSERPYNSMLNGSVCLIDGNLYLQEDYVDGKDIMFFDMNHPEDEARRIKSLLGESGHRTLERIAKMGYERASKTESWGNRTRDILGIMKVLERAQDQLRGEG